MTFAHHDNVEEVIVRQSVEDLVDSRLCNLDPQPLHAAADIQQDDHVLGARRCPDVPASCHSEPANCLYIYTSWSSVDLRM